MNPPLVREGAASDVGGALVGGHVRHVGDETRGLRKLAQCSVGEAPIAHLQLERRNDGAQVGVAAPLAVAVDRPLELRRPRADRGESVRRAAADVVVRVDAEGDGELAPDQANDLLDPPGDRAAVRVAQNDGLGPAAHRRPERLEGVRLVGREAVEEVLRVVEDALPLGDEESDGLLDHP